ncbi:MAG: hypothetical protein COW03_05770 [Cytophagales bacterium CG12_big_fil_rev_8_21_14_0_65_40_12]|nr:MAG: hypothetical protein COW03_05770 [Cytophagales bacterium CG12_big_fil_rev_8_21_14_0_65_40_12]PIW03238.1 MAG: hypothetical protein COW40_16015 [Cytophagales bacterium CG17_big_fil_post_rev_8_21_14_2_50_40_13]
MKKNILFSLFLLLFYACEEGGLTIEVPATGSFDFTINSSVANNSPNNEFTNQRNIDPGALVNESAESIKSISLTKFTYNITGYTGAAPVQMNLTLSTRLDGVTTEVLLVSGVTLQNGLVTAFERGNANSLLSAAQVASLEAIIDNQEPFELILTAGFDRDIESDFNLQVVWDLIASVAQPTE